MTSKEFRLLRNRLGLTQVALADQLDISWITVSRLERGIRVPKLYALAIMALIMAVPDRDAA